MSQGNRIIPVRFSRQDIDDIQELIALRNAVTREKPWTMSDFIRKCVYDKMRHAERSRRKRKR